MPIQIDSEKFVQFNYNPDYLQSKTQLKTISNVSGICKALNLTPIQSNLVVDGGNVIRTKDKVIMCDKVFKENPTISEKELIKQLKDTFEVDKLFFVPWNKSDYTGHADGMIRFLDSNTVIINDYSREKTFQKKFLKSLSNAKLNYVSIPYDPYDNKYNDQANGIYINYLQMKDIVFVPTFGKKEDDIALKQFEQYFKTVVPVESKEIACEGGVLNCISWNICVI